LRGAGERHGDRGRSDGELFDHDAPLAEIDVGIAARSSSSWNRPLFVRPPNNCRS
jgi:hypothetical protein